MGNSLILVVQVVGVLPNVKRQYRLEAMRHRIISTNVLINGKLTGGIGLEPDPAGAKEGGATLNTTEFSVPLLSYQKKSLSKTDIDLALEFGLAFKQKQ